MLDNKLRDNEIIVILCSSFIILVQTSYTFVQKFSKTQNMDCGRKLAFLMSDKMLKNHSVQLPLKLGL